ncbi:hypothetical protein M404DRAFT_995662 [Pisolithus tinctorius Marx 270]|uniref:Uncharacterized protein n=1 Tax=Pisolithus tinctorius Marx 270 TaxID=870435 RepID=A0A0C3PA54_PISTI|nr:hypothetical protein M404DRAFT_995662 [Pisolithus tinctorius Marx 270]
MTRRDGRTQHAQLPPLSVIRPCAAQMQFANEGSKLSKYARLGRCRIQEGCQISSSERE